MYAVLRLQRFVTFLNIINGHYSLFLCLCQSRLTGGIISTSPLVSYQNFEHDILKTNKQILTQIGTSGPCDKVDETSNFVATSTRSKFKSTGSRPELYLESWRRHHCRPVESTRFSSSSKLLTPSLHCLSSFRFIYTHHHHHHLSLL